MIQVSKSQVKMTSPTSLFAEASTLGLRPGEWPDWIAVLDERGEGFLFGFPEPTPVGGRVYQTNDGAFQLTVAND